MDWIEEKTEQIRIRLRNLSLRKAMVGYLVIMFVIVVILSFITMVLCIQWEKLLWAQNMYIAESNQGEIAYTAIDWTMWSSFIRWIEAFLWFQKGDRMLMYILDAVRIWCPLIYSFLGIITTIIIFYRKRLQIPFEILHQGTEAIKRNNLDFNCHYENRDEMGQLSESFEEMRQELIRNKEQMWGLIENQKCLNAAFAHDLRTPLTVLKGYSDFLARYIPEGKINEEKMVDTLKLMSSHLERLEHYSRTMKGIRSIDEMPLEREETNIASILKEFQEVIFSLNQVGDIQIELEKVEKHFLNIELFTDKNIIMEVLENLLSNAIRYAKKRIQVLPEYEEASCQLIIAVRDDGAGFSKEDLQKAIDPYYREYGEDGEHFGIGLHICSLLCAKHGGTLNVANSVIGGGIVTASFSCNKE